MRSDPAATGWLAFRTAIRAHIANQIEDERVRGESMRSQVVPRVHHAIRVARESGRVRNTWLFGSFAWDLPREGSDVDLLVEGCDEPFALAGELSAACDRNVHVIELGDAPASLRERVLREGKPL